MSLRRSLSLSEVSTFSFGTSRSLIFRSKALPTSVLCESEAHRLGREALRLLTAVAFVLFDERESEEWSGGRGKGSIESDLPTPSTASFSLSLSFAFPTPQPYPHFADTPPLVPAESPELARLIDTALTFDRPVSPRTRRALLSLGSVGTSL